MIHNPVSPGEEMRFLPVCGLSWVLFITTITLNVSPSFAQIGVEPDWSTSAKIAPGGRPNPYEWDETTLKEKVKRGRDYALHYPVTVTGLLLPAKPTLKILNAKPGDALFTLMKTVLSFKKDFKNFKGFWEWMGLVSYPSEEKELYPMGVSFIERHGVQGVTFGCAACHTGELFGKQIVGLTNRFPRANQFFIEGKKALRGISPEIFAVTLGATSGEKAMYRESREKILSVETTSPVTLGLDTSLAQVALSLARRAPGIDAERTANNAKHPRPTLLDHLVADSKPSGVVERKI